MKAGRIAALTVLLVLWGMCTYAADCNNGGRYEDMGNGTVTDCRTGLIWLKDANCTEPSGGIGMPDGYLNYSDAKKWVAGLESGLCGLTDGSYPGFWRLPTITEWMAMVASANKQGFTEPALTDGAGTARWTDGNIFYNVRSQFYWSSTTYAADTSSAWNIVLGIGIVWIGNKEYGSYVWPVRGGQSASFGSLTIE